MSKKITVYTPETAYQNPLQVVLEVFRDFRDSHDLARRLAIRDITSQYRQSILGIAWAFIIPLANTLTWVFLNGTGIVAVGDTPIPYPAYVFSGTMIWAILVYAINSPQAETVSNKAILTKIHFPREALILSGFYKLSFNGLIKIALVVVALMSFGIFPTWIFLYFPFALLCMIMFGLTIGLIIAPVGTLFNDVGKALQTGFKFVMYVTPVLFPMPTAGVAKYIFEFNPLSYFILVNRDLLTGITPQYLNTFVILSVLSFVVFIMATVVYKKVMPILIERMST